MGVCGIVKSIPFQVYSEVSEFSKSVFLWNSGVEEFQLKTLKIRRIESDEIE